MAFVISGNAQNTVVIVIGSGMNGPINIIHWFVFKDFLTESTMRCLYRRYIVKSSLKMCVLKWPVDWIYYTLLVFHVWWLTLFLFKPSHITQQMLTSQPIRSKNSSDACMTDRSALWLARQTTHQALHKLSQHALLKLPCLVQHDCHVIIQKLGNVTKMSQWRHHGH